MPTAPTEAPHRPTAATGTALRPHTADGRSRLPRRRIRTGARERRRGARLRRTAVALGLVLSAVCTTVGWSAASAQTPVTGPAPGAAAWRADTSSGRLPDPASASAREVARFFAGLDADRRRALAARHPSTVGNLDGAPVPLRYAANRAALEAAGRAARAAGRPGQAARYLALARPGRQILSFDPRGRGTVAEVLGDLGKARRVAVLVPGSDTDLTTYDRPGTKGGTPAAAAAALYRRAARTAPGVPVAVVVWAGYTTPVGVGPDAASSRLARAGAPRLDRFLEGLAASTAPAAPPALLCHSYGSVVCGLAASSLAPDEASDLVLLASPGAGAGSAEELRTDARVWAGRAPDDWIRHVPHVSLAGLGHGADPVDPAFGARRLSTAGARGHSGYFAPGTGSLASLTALVLGRWSDVACADTDPECRRDLP
ncbi:alpha/beta hydrolase family protein [Streptomyces thermolineatus]|uniref:Alpha/beta hydrolase family protein n=1 Tax=Streptomyces thermolineatus TaxID=44033 RepID=A0ABN3MM03_9ACTN